MSTNGFDEAIDPATLPGAPDDLVPAPRECVLRLDVDRPQLFRGAAAGERPIGAVLLIVIGLHL